MSAFEFKDAMEGWASRHEKGDDGVRGKMFLVRRDGEEVGIEGEDRGYVRGKRE